MRRPKRRLHRNHGDGFSQITSRVKWRKDGKVARNPDHPPQGVGFRPQGPTSYSIWSMVRDGSAQPAVPTTRAGMPATVVLCGTALSTTDPAATRAQCPTSILPRILAPAPIITPRRIFG